MTFCPVCKTEWREPIQECPVCGRELEKDNDDTNKSEWIVLGMIEDKMSADFAKETLTSYEIPSVVISKSGFFGNIGLPLNPFYKPGSSLFQISVRSEDAEEAADILSLILGDKWQRENH